MRTKILHLTNKFTLTSLHTKKAIMKKTFFALFLIFVAIKANAGVLVFTDRIQWTQALSSQTIETETFSGPYQIINKGQNNFNNLVISTDADDPGAGFFTNLIPQNRIENGKLQFRLSNGYVHPTGLPVSTYFEISNGKPITAFGADYVGPANSAVLLTKVGNQYIDFSNYFLATSSA